VTVGENGKKWIGQKRRRSIPAVASPKISITQGKSIIITEKQIQTSTRPQIILVATSCCILLQKGRNGLARELSETTWHLTGGMPQDMPQGHKKKGRPTRRRRWYTQNYVNNIISCGFLIRGTEEGNERKVEWCP
jgi:hypothetical protein